MAKFVSSLREYLISILLIIARAILFIFCIRVAIGSLIFFFACNKPEETSSSSSGGPTPEAINSPEKLSLYIQHVLLLVISAIGIYGTYKRDLRYLQFFALVIASLAVVNGVAIYHDYREQDSELARFRMGMSFAELKYGWYQTGANEETLAWDTLQEKTECCGLKNASDWDYLRPTHLAKDTLPGSCCPSQARAESYDGRCHHEDAYKVGCLTLFGQLKRMNRTNRITVVVQALIAALLALCIAKPPGKSSTGGAGRRPPTSGCPYFARVHGVGCAANRQPQPHELTINQEKAPSNVIVIKSAPPPSYIP
uniref:CD63 antigen n=1 Tax=Aceria tosichella TaxID=561515 RepID=A0A6G1S514_9ACAR